MSQWSEVEPQLNIMVNQWYDTPEIKRLLTVPLTPKRRGGHGDGEVGLSKGLGFRVSGLSK